MRACIRHTYTLIVLWLLIGCGATPAAPQATAPPTTVPSQTPSATPQPSPTPQPSATPAPHPTTTPSPTPLPSPTPALVNGQLYEIYHQAADKQGQAYRYSCEFDAAWVILQTFGVDVTVDDLIARMPFDHTVTPSYVETADGFVIYGGDITRAFSGDYRESFLARSTGAAFQPLFAHYGMPVTPVSDRAEVENALRSGALIWMKTTVDFKPWRPATWIMPDGSTRQTVLGNDHAVVAVGFNSNGVAIRDVLGPTSSNQQRPTSYHVDWERFMAAWGAQSFDGLAIWPANAS